MCGAFLNKALQPRHHEVCHLALSHRIAEHCSCDCAGLFAAKLPAVISQNKVRPDSMFSLVAGHFSRSDCAMCRGQVMRSSNQWQSVFNSGRMVKPTQLQQTHEMNITPLCGFMLVLFDYLSWSPPRGNSDLPVYLPSIHPGQPTPP